MRRSRACDCATRSSVLTHLFERARISRSLTLCWARTTARAHGSQLRVGGGGGEGSPRSGGHVSASGSTGESSPAFSSINVLAFFLDADISTPAPISVSLFLFSFFSPSSEVRLPRVSDAHPTFRIPSLCVAVVVLVCRHARRLRATADGSWQVDVPKRAFRMLFFVFLETEKIQALDRLAEKVVFPFFFFFAPPARCRCFVLSFP